MSSILITGVHGFIGNKIVAVLKEQHLLYGLDIVSPKKEGVISTFNWNELDRIPHIDLIIHLAGIAHDTRNKILVRDYFDINTGLSKRIFDWFLLSGAKKFVFFSSVKAAADTVENILTEDIVPDPKSPYGESKIAAEKYITQHATPDSLVYILRPCMIHGPGNKGNLNLLFKIQQKGLPWPLGAFENKRSFCAIDNILFVVEQLIEKNIKPGIYQVADDDAISTNALIKLMALSQNKKARIWNIPAKSINAIARMGDLFHLPLNSERLKKLTESYIVSNLKIKSALGIERMPVSVVNGLKKTFESFKM